MMRTLTSPNFPSIETFISGNNLQAMDELIEPHAVKGIWPEERQIWSCAMTLQCPRRDSAYAQTVIRSPMGGAAPCRGLDGRAFLDRTAPRTAAGQVNRHGSRHGADAENEKRRVIHKIIEAASGTGRRRL